MRPIPGLSLMQQYFICTIHFMLYCRKVKMLHYNIFWESIGRKVFTKIKSLSRPPTSDSSKLHQFVSSDVWVMFLVVFKALFTELCNCACAKKIVMLIRIRHICVVLLHKKTVLSLKTSSEINFEFIKLVKKENVFIWQKQIGNII